MQVLRSIQGSTTDDTAILHELMYSGTQGVCAVQTVMQMSRLSRLFSARFRLLDGFATMHRLDDGIKMVGPCA